MSVKTQVKPANDAERFVTITALTALEFIAVSLPPLNPNQPTQISVVPIKTSDIFSGRNFFSGKPFLGLIARAYVKYVKFYFIQFN